MDDYIIQQIRLGRTSRDQAIADLLKNTILTNKIRNYVQKNGGDDIDYKTVLTDTVIAFSKRVIQEKDFVISNSIESYLIGISKNVWLGYLRKRKKDIPTQMTDIYENMVDSNENKIDLLIRSERSITLSKILDHMGDKCKEILMYWSMSYKMEEITQKLGMTSEGNTRKKKHECMETLKKYIQQNPHLKEALS